MIQLIRFYLRSTGLLLLALLIGSIVINGLALILTWLSKKPAIFISLPLTTGVLMISLFVIAIRLNLKDLKMNSFTLAGMLPVSQAKLLGAKLVAGCSIILVGVLMQMILGVGLVSMSGHPEVLSIFGDSVVVFQEQEGTEGHKSVTIVETGKDGKVKQEVSIQVEKGTNGKGVEPSGGSAKEENVAVGVFSVGGAGNFKTDNVGTNGDNMDTAIGVAIGSDDIRTASLFGMLAVPMFFMIVVCFGVYPFVWARYFTKKAFLAKVLAVVFIGLIFTVQGAVTKSTGYLLGISTEAAHSGADWISFGWNLAICTASYLFTAWFREEKMDLI